MSTSWLGTFGISRSQYSLYLLNSILVFRSCLNTWPPLYQFPSLPPSFYHYILHLRQNIYSLNFTKMLLANSNRMPNLVRGPRRRFAAKNSGFHKTYWEFTQRKAHGSKAGWNGPNLHWGWPKSSRLGPDQPWWFETRIGNIQERHTRREGQIWCVMVISVSPNFYGLCRQYIVGSVRGLQAPSTTAVDTPIRKT